MENLVTIIHVVVSLAVIGLVLVQHGKGADAGAAFGGNSSGSVFGAQGSGNFVTRLTAVEQIQENSSQSVETKEQPFGSDEIGDTQDIPN